MPERLEKIGQLAIDHLTLKHAARELALPKSRATIRLCANSIRAIHRQEWERAEELQQQAAQLLAEMSQDLQHHQDIYFAGFVQDAHKEYAEARTFLAFVRHQPLPEATDIGLGWAAYLNGMAEAVGELRRYLLDQLRRGNYEDCEIYLGYMDDVYALLTTIDFPDAITSGLRRTTDATRGILEKTRGDLTTSLRQARLERSLQSLQETLILFQQESQE
jgi:translin